MSLLILNIPSEIVNVLVLIFAVLIICSIVFRLIYSKKKNDFWKEIIIRTNSWWKIAAGIAILVTAPALVGTLLIAYVSFVALREMFSISHFRNEDRVALFVGYFAVPIQYYLAYNNYYEAFLYFIPLVMFIAIPVVLVFNGKTEKIGRSMSIIPSLIMLTVYMLSHLVLLFHIETANFNAGAGGLILFLIVLIAFNDVFQFTWGKLLGKHKILPRVSPNKTWEGFIGGIFTTAIFAVANRFLTPLAAEQAFIVGLVIGITGFLGDALISAIKRDLKLKDTDDLIPGHGGVMDRLDSIILITPIYYHLLKFLIR